jgi:hypothetical protein
MACVALCVDGIVILLPVTFYLSLAIGAVIVYVKSQAQTKRHAVAVEAFVAAQAKAAAAQQREGRRAPGRAPYPRVRQNHEVRGCGYGLGLFQKPEKRTVVLKAFVEIVLRLFAGAGLGYFLCVRMGIPLPVITCLWAVMAATLIYLKWQHNAKATAAVVQATAAAQQALNEALIRAALPADGSIPCAEAAPAATSP